MNKTPALDNQQTLPVPTKNEPLVSNPHGSTRPVHAGVPVPVTASGLY